MRPRKRKFHQYSEENIDKALNSIRNGATIREACRNYSVPRTTVQDRLSGRTLSKPRQMGPDPYLSIANEKK